MIVREVLQRSATWLDKKGSEAARLEAELLLAHVLGTERLGLYAAAERRLGDGELESYRGLLRRRADGEPVAYLTGRREFYGLELEITRDVLVPRPETELLVDRARELRPARILDLGTGSGCVAIACASQMPDATVTATDVSDSALEVASNNAARHGVSDRIRFLQGDLFDPLTEDERFDLIVSNPPYVPEGEAASVAAHEPRLALYAGKEGLEVIERLLAAAPGHLAGGGTLLIEIGEDQEAAVRECAAAHFGQVQITPDLRRLFPASSKRASDLEWEALPRRPVTDCRDSSIVVRDRDDGLGRDAGPDRAAAPR
ncbi:MAG: peptide chain release factor N(5)-glutamine methyltransferase [Planctomycetota bacterium]